MFKLLLDCLLYCMEIGPKVIDSFERVTERERDMEGDGGIEKEKIRRAERETRKKLVRRGKKELAAIHMYTL